MPSFQIIKPSRNAGQIETREQARDSESCLLEQWSS